MPYINDFLLCLLSTYDENPSDKDQIINTALSISEYLLELEPDLALYLINRYQVLDRMGLLVENELHDLQNLCIDPSIGQPELACALALCGRKEEAQCILELLDYEVRMTIADYPINKYFH